MKKRNSVIILITAVLIVVSFFTVSRLTASHQHPQSKFVAQNPENYTKEDLLGKSDITKDTAFIKIPQYLTPKTNIYLRKETLAAFIRMHDKAAADGVKLTIVSATRTFEMQKKIWEDKWTGIRPVGGKKLNVAIPDPVKRAKEILRYSSMPGTSRHHWGTDIDINSVDPAYFKLPEGKKVLAWLEKNAAEFGFYRPYTPFDSSRTSGYQPEEWHWSYLPQANELFKAYIEKIHLIDIDGFQGDETVFDIDVINIYVRGIHASCNPLLIKAK